MILELMAQLISIKRNQFNRKKKTIELLCCITPFRNGVQHQYKSCFDMELMESSFDLMQNPFSQFQRSSWMMPTPFV
jgi:hypothetical protein